MPDEVRCESGAWLARYDLQQVHSKIYAKHKHEHLRLSIPTTVYAHSGESVGFPCCRLKFSFELSFFGSVGNSWQCPRILMGLLLDGVDYCQVCNKKDSPFFFVLNNALKTKIMHYLIRMKRTLFVFWGPRSCYLDLHVKKCFLFNK